jgi:MscS family membrane protein
MMLRRISFLAIWLGFASALVAREADNNTTAAAAAATVTKTHEDVAAPPTIMEQLVDNMLARFGVHDTGNTTKRVLIVTFIVLLTLLLRRVVVALVFRVLGKLAARTTSTLDDRLISALHRPAGALITVTGIFAALAVLRFPPSVDRALGYGSTMAFSLVIFWGLYRMFGALLDHTHEVAVERQLGVAAFMPWIKRTLVALFIGVGVLLIIQSLGYNVSTILQGLGIGGLAFALAAQDTIANLFGSIVVAVDQPFLIGETVTIAAHTGTVEDIGLRSTKLRRVDKSLVVIPNRSVANEPIVNLSRFTARRVEQVFTLTYDARPEDMEAIVNDIRGIIRAEPEVDQTATMVYFRDLNSSSLDIWTVYVVNHPDFDRHMAVRQRVNVAVMRAVAARGLSFAFPTQTMHLPAPVVDKLTDRKNP